jgi:2-dehydropantoate 2-reductase
VLVVGLGSVGSLLVYVLNRAGIVPVVVGRSTSKSLRLRVRDSESVGLSCKVVSWSEVSGGWDFVLVATKAYDALEVAEKLAGMEFGLAVFVQNGLGVLEHAEGVLGRGRVAQLVLNHGVYYSDELGEFVWVGGGRSYLGMRGPPARELYELANSLGMLDVTVVDDVEPYRWLKLAVNASINPITAVLRVPNGYLVRVPELTSLVRRVASEVAEVARKAGISLPADPGEEALEVARRTAGNISSMLADLRSCRRTEVDFINGAVVELGRRLGVNTPYNEALYILVKSLELVCSGGV